MKIELKTLLSNKIDAAKWNACIAINKAPIYCRYNYLNAMANNWIGIVVNNYEAVMPICIKQKFGIKYCYTPAFMQQLGIVGLLATNNNNDFIKTLQSAIYSIVKFGDIHFNDENIFAEAFAVKQSNFVLNLNNNYAFIYENYKQDLKNNLKKVAKLNLCYTNNTNIEAAILQYKKMYADRIKNICEKDYTNFNALCSQLALTNNCITRQIVTAQNEVLCTALLLIDENRIYNIANSNTEIGRTTEANHLLFDRIINEFSNTDFIFDFEGSELPGVKSFYQKFGAINQPYFHWHFNKLPWFIKLIKK